MGNATVLVNGVASDRIAVTDRGLNYGDGVFRTLRVAQHAPVAWLAQMERLNHDCRRLALPAPDERTLLAEARSLFSQRAGGVLKIVVTRGGGGRGYAPPERPETTRIVSAHALPPPVTELVLDVSRMRLARQPALAGVKHLNRLEQVLARNECLRRGRGDALMLDSADYVIGTTMRNILLHLDGQWVTPALDQAGVAGATRARMMAALAQAGEPVAQTALTLNACYRAQAMIACNSVSGITAVTRLAGYGFPFSLKMAAHCRALADIEE